MLGSCPASRLLVSLLSTSALVTATMREPRFESGSSTAQHATSAGVTVSKASSTATKEIISPPILTNLRSLP